MSANQAPTRREAEHEEALRRFREIDGQKGELDRRRETLTREIDQLREQRAELQRQLHGHLERATAAAELPKDVPKLRAKIAGISSEVQEKLEFRDHVDRKLAQVNAEHGPAYMQWQTAQRALKREPCEQALEELDRLFRQVEQAWTIAGHEARALDTGAPPDSWGVGKLAEITARGFNAYVHPDGPYTLRLPRLEELS